MKFYIKQMLVLFLASLACLFYLEAYAAPPVKVTVTAAVPNSAFQGDTAEVAIDGTGFDAGSTARFIVTDSRDDTQIDVNEVTFDAASGKLNAKIKVKDAALPVEYDIEVTTSTGRRGKGTTLFRVRQKVGTDPCVTDFSPDYVFWRDAVSKRVPGVKVFLADSTTSCETELVYIPLQDIGPISRLNLNFSARMEEGIFHGRVIWTKKSKSIWKYDFHVEQGLAIPDEGEPTMILENTDSVNQSLGGLALSPNGKTLAYLHIESYADWTEYSIRTVDIDSCGNVCAIDSGEVVGFVRDFYPISENSFGSLAWGPLGQRIYVVEFEAVSIDEVRTYNVRFYDLAKAEWTSLFKVDNPPESLGSTSYRMINKIASGIPKGCNEPYDCEYLAVQIFWTWGYSCANLHLVRVNDCNGVDDSCLSAPVIAGVNPSWTEDGSLLHSYQGWTNRDTETHCATNLIGLWDGENLESTMKGIEPKAASFQH